MSIRFRKTPILAFLVLAYAGAILYWDRGYFFPLGAHSDWRFQVTGEVVELLVVAAIWPVVTVLGRRCKLGPVGNRGVEAVLNGGGFAVFMLAIRWRSMFVDGHFNGFEAHDPIVETVLVGVTSWAFFFLWPDGKMKKPSPEEEKSVV